MLLQSNNIRRFYFPEIGSNFKIEVAYVLGQIRNYFPIRFTTLKTNLISNSKVPISSLYYISEGVLNKLKNIDLTEDEANIIYPHCITTLNSAINLYKKVNKIRFYLDNETISMAEKSVDNFYEVESMIRKVAYQNKPIDKGDKIINEFASQISQHSLSLNEV